MVFLDIFIFECFLVVKDKDMVYNENTVETRCKTTDCIA